MRSASADGVAGAVICFALTCVPRDGAKALSGLGDWTVATVTLPVVVRTRNSSQTA